MNDARPEPEAKPVADTSQPSQKTSDSAEKRKRDLLLRRKVLAGPTGGRSYPTITK